MILTNFVSGIALFLLEASQSKSTEIFLRGQPHRPIHSMTIRLLGL